MTTDELEWLDTVEQRGDARLVDPDIWINQRTGEMIKTHTLTREVKGDVDVGFEKLWIGHILDAVQEVGNAKMKVLFWLIRNKDRGNMVYGGVNEIATKTGVGRATVARLMSALRKANVVRLEYGGRWMLNPSVVFKGGHDRRMNVLIRYKSMEQHELPLEGPIDTAAVRKVA